jgi:SAM-dependent methyltransferase
MPTPPEPHVTPAPAPGRRRRRAVEAVHYLGSRLAGKSYPAYQAARYDRLWRAQPDHFSHPDRSFQLDYCRRRGLAPDHRLLDFGCGPLAAGLHFLRYLAPDRYFAADISARALALGRARVEAAGLADRRPTLLLLAPPDSLTPVRGLACDMVWAQSVLTHMAPGQIESLVAELPGILAAGGQLLASAYLGDRCRRISFKDWGYTSEFFADLARRTGTVVELLTDFRHPRPFEPPGYRMRMLRFRVAAPSAARPR